LVDKRGDIYLVAVDKVVQLDSSLAIRSHLIALGSILVGEENQFSRIRVIAKVGDDVKRRF
jgi:hypothetical protein